MMLACDTLTDESRASCASLAHRIMDPDTGMGVQWPMAPSLEHLPTLVTLLNSARYPKTRPQRIIHDKKSIFLDSIKMGLSGL